MMGSKESKIFLAKFLKSLAKQLLEVAYNGICEAIITTLTPQQFIPRYKYTDSIPSQERNPGFIFTSLGR